MEREYYLIVEEHINATENYSYGRDELPIEDSRVKNLKDLYKFGLKEFGRCINKVYIDRNNKTLHIGYIFQKKRKYTDVDEYYINETWLTLEHYIETINKKYLPI